MEDFDAKQFILMMKQIAEEKNLPVDTVQDALEHALAAAYRKDYGTRDQNIQTKINPKTGDFKLYEVKEVVQEVEEPENQIALADAKKAKKDAKVGEEIKREVTAEKFGRVAAQTAKQVILQKLREAERDVISAEYSDKVGTILNGTIQRIEPRVVYVDLGRAQGILPASEQIPGEHYRSSQRLKVYLRDVESSPRGPQLILSRANEDFVRLLFEREVPEMENNAVEIKAIAREAGARTKVAVASSVPGVDPVGTFVGGHGTRVQAVMGELAEEKIDIVMYEEDPETMITNALAPTKIGKIELDEKNQSAKVVVPQDQLSVAIGRQGQNVRLASKLTGWQIDIESTDRQVAGAAAGPGPKKSEKSKEISDKPKQLASKADLEAALLESIEAGDKEAEEKVQQQLDEKKAEEQSEEVANSSEGTQKDADEDTKSKPSEMDATGSKGQGVSKQKSSKKSEPDKTGAEKK